MFAGHFGVAAAVKAKTPNLPLWPIMVSTQLIDIIFVPLFVSKIETMSNVSANNYGGSIIYAFYSHSLVGTLLLALLVGLVSSRIWGKQSGFILGCVVFSHWLLDLLVHRPDLPILPGNFGNLPLLGLGLWNFPIVTMSLEAALIIIGAVMYYKSITLKNNGGKTVLNMTTGIAMTCLLVLSLVSNIIGI